MQPSSRHPVGGSCPIQRRGFPHDVTQLIGPAGLPPGLETLSAQLREIVGMILGISPDRARAMRPWSPTSAATSLDFVELVMAVEEVFGIEILIAAADRS